MTPREIEQFIEKAISPKGGTWADLGAGNGKVTMIVRLLLGKEGKVFAVDTNPQINNLSDNPTVASVIRIQQDFTQPLDLPILDGILMANSLHFVKDKKAFLQQLIPKLKPDGKLVFIEYDMEIGNQWIPYPITIEGLRKLTVKLNLTEAEELNRRESTYGNGGMYLAVSYKKE